MPKVDYADLESVTKFLDRVVAIPDPFNNPNKIQMDAKKLSKMIKDKYTEIKPDYESTN
jgi:hypothetical protein